MLVKPTVLIIDSDPTMRHFVADVAIELDHDVESFTCAEEFLDCRPLGKSN